MAGDDEIRGELTQSMRDEFLKDAGESAQRDAKSGKKDDGKAGRCEEVTNVRVNDALNAVKSMAQLSSKIEMPHWLTDEPPFPAGQCIVTKNAIVNLPNLITSKPCKVLPTPDLFHANALPFAFNPEAQCPRWLKFLDEIFSGDEQSIAALGEWIGYNLLPDVSQHKMLMLIGPARSGKSIVGRILQQLVGELNSANPTLADLAGPFGMQGLLGKMSAVVGDAGLSSKVDQHAILETSAWDSR